MTTLWALAALGLLAYAAVWLWGWRDGEDVRWQVLVICLLWTVAFGALAIIRGG